VAIKKERKRKEINLYIWALLKKNILLDDTDKTSTKSVMYYIVNAFLMKFHTSIRR
jgi:hypothetical protein